MREFWNRETALWAILIVSVVLTAVAGSVNVQRMVASERLLQTTRVAIAEMTAVLSELVDAETGHRGYLLTGQDAHLDPFRSADADVWGQLADLRRQMAESPDQLARLDTVERLAREKFTDMRKMIAVRDASGRDAAAAAVAGGTGKGLMDDLRARTRDVLAAEEARMAERAAAATAYYHTAELTTLLGAGLALGVLAGVAALTRRESRRLAQVAGKLAAAKVETDAALGRLDAFLRHAPYGIAYFDQDLRFVRVNDTFARTHGVRIDAHLGRPLTDVLPQYPPDLLAEYRRVLVTGDGLSHRLVRGPDLAWEVTAFAVPDAAGGRGLGVIGLNVTDRHRQEEQLRASEEQFRAMADGISQLAWMTRPDGHIFWYNQRWHEYTGTTLAEMDGWGWEMVHDPAELPRVLVAWKAALAVGAPFEDTFPLRRHDGQMRWHLTRAVPHKDADGRVLLWFGTNTDITDQRDAERALRQSEARFRELADAMPQIVYATDPVGQVLFINRRWVEYTGQTDAQTADLTLLVPPEELDEMLGRWARATAAGTPFEAEFRLLGRGEVGYRWFLTRAVPVRDADGRVVRWYGTSTDIHEHKRIEQQVRDAASQQRQLTEGMPLLMWACRPTGECDYLSLQWVEYTGVPEADQLPHGWLDTLHPDDRQPTALAWRMASEESGEYDVEFRLRRHDGEYRWFAARGIPLRDHDGRTVRWYGSCTDIENRKQQTVTLEKLVTERTADLHRANTELREQQIFLDAILDTVAEGIMACDSDGRLKVLNAATRRMHALPVERLPAEPLPPDRWVEHYRVYDADGLTAMPADRVPLARAWAGEEVRDAEMMIRTPDRSDRYVLCSGGPLRAADGRQFGAVVSLRDMTERREYERQLLVTAAALKVSNEELEKFAYIASHDLQEPLRKIQAFGTRLAAKSRDLLGEQGQDYIHRMLDSAGRMRKLIEDLLAFSRVATKTVPFAPADLAAVVRDVLKDLELRVQQSGGRVQVGPLPFVRGDASQLRQVFQNLIGNALKFARPGVPPLVRVTAVPFHQLPPDADPVPPDGAGWRIAVEDNGIGFEQGYGERIFELFQRLHSRIQYEGTGLGLAIVRKIILRYGATIAARGTPNEGAAFLIDWPQRALPPT